jgi:hypothetical protein
LENLHFFLMQYPFFMVNGQLWTVYPDTYRAYSICDPDRKTEGCGLGYLARQRRVVVPDPQDVWRGKLKKGAFDNWAKIPLTVDNWTAKYIKNRLTPAQ